MRRLCLFALGCAAALADTVVVPNAQATAAGNMPMPPSTTALRFQQIVGGGQFTGPITIVGLHVRSSPGAGPLSYSASSWQITVSSTQAYPNTSNTHTLPSTTYASNVGADATLVYNGPVSFSSPGCGAPGPCSFDVYLPFSTPFAYDPNKGRLLIDIVSAASTGTITGSYDGVAFSDSTQSTVASVSGDPTMPGGTRNLSGIVYGLEVDAPCNSSGNLPCTVAGTMLATSASGPLFGGSGAMFTGFTPGQYNAAFINDPQTPGVAFNGGPAAIIGGPGPGTVALNGTLNLATLSGAAAINGAIASITCGVTGNATATLTVSAGGSSNTLTCPKTSTRGAVVQLFARLSFPAAKSASVTVTIAMSAPASTDSVSWTAFSTQASFVSSAPSILTDTGVINGGNYGATIVSGSWVAIKGSGLTDPGVTMDWSKSDFSNGLPTSLNGVQVLFNGQPGAMWYLIDGPTQQINVQAPANLIGPVSVQVVRNKIASNVVMTTAVPVSPGIFSYSLDGGVTFFPAAVFGNGSPLGDPTVYPGSRAAKAGDTVVIFANSLAVSPAGQVQVSGSTHTVMISIGPATFAADFSGLVAPGEFQINFTVPRVGPSGNLPFLISIDGQPSQQGVYFPYTN